MSEGQGMGGTWARRARIGAALPVVLWSSALALFATGCMTTLPQAETPAHIAPSLEGTPAPRPGEGRLIVDVVEGSTTVHQVTLDPSEVQDDLGRARYQFYDQASVLCDETPCVIDAPVGNLLLGFPIDGQRRGLEVDLVHIGDDPSVYRRSLTVRGGSSGAYVLGIVGATFGGMSFVTGATFLPIGLAKDRDGLTMAGTITLGAGVVLTALSIWAMIADAPTYRPGSWTHFALDEAQ